MANDFTYNLKTWAGEVAQSVHGCTGDPSQAMTDSIVKIAQREDLNTDQVERLCEQSNYDVYVDCYRQDPESVYTSPTVEKQAVLKALHGEPHEKDATPPVAHPSSHQKHADYFTRPPAPNLGAYDPMDVFAKVLNTHANTPVDPTIEKVAHQGLPITRQTLDRPVVGQGHNGLPVLTHQLDKAARMHKQAYDQLRSIYLFTVMQKEALDESLYQEVRKMILEGTSLEDVFEYLGQLDPSFQTSTDQLSGDAEKLVNRLKQENLMSTEAEVVRQASPVAMDTKPRVINIDTSLFVPVQQGQETREKVAIAKRAMDHVKEKLDVFVHALQQQKGNAYAWG